MESAIYEAALSQGIWAVVAIFLLIYIVKENQKRDQKQEEREINYQNIIKQLTERFYVLDEVKKDIIDIKELITSKSSTGGSNKSADKEDL